MMKKHSYGDETKDKIFNASKTLFYDKGYRATSIRDISNQANINAALISYHFKGKSNLGLEVCNTFTSDIKEIISQNVKVLNVNLDLDPLVGVALEFRIFALFRRRNKNYRRFIKELCDVNTLLKSDNYMGIGMFSELNEKYGVFMNEVDVRIAHYSITSIISGLIIVHDDGFIDCSYDYLSDKEITIMLSILQIKEEKKEEILVKSRELLNQIEITMEKDFIVF